MKLKNKYLRLLILAIIAAYGDMANPTSTIPVLPLSTHGNKITLPNGKKIVLRGVSPVDPEIIWNNRPGLSYAKFLDFVKENYPTINTIRLMVLPNPDAEEGTQGYFANPTQYIKQYLQPALDECINRGFYVVLDLHYIAQYDSSLTQNNLIPYWRKMAMRYKNMPNILFEIMNEPITPDDWKTWVDTVAQPVVNAIRKIAAKNIIIVGGPRWDQNIQDAVTYPVKGKNIVYVAHVYPQNNINWDIHLGVVADKYPLFVTEWGYQPSGPMPINGTLESFGKPFLDWMESRGISWSAFAFDPNWKPQMLKEDASGNLQQNPGVNDVIINYTPPVKGYALTQCKSNGEYFNGFYSICAKSRVSGGKLTDILDCLSIPYNKSKKVNKLLLRFDIHSRAGSCWNAPYIAITGSSETGSPLFGNSPAYSCNDDATYKDIEIPLSQAQELQDLYLSATTGDWCSSFDIRNVIFQ